MLIATLMLAAAAPCEFPKGFESWGSATTLAEFDKLRLIPGKARDIPLKPVSESWFFRSPKKAPKPGTYGGYDRYIGFGLYRVAIGAAPGKPVPQGLSLEMWGEFGDIPAIRVEPAAPCTGMVNVFTISAPRAFTYFQLHGATSKSLRIMMVPN